MKHVKTSNIAQIKYTQSLLWLDEESRELLRYARYKTKRNMSDLTREAIKKDIKKGGDGDACLEK